MEIWLLEVLPVVMSRITRTVVLSKLEKNAA
nr:MAG TPA: hypothetical protein [Caudoviricetes sp.]